MLRVEEGAVWILPRDWVILEADVWALTEAAPLAAGKNS